MYTLLLSTTQTQIMHDTIFVTSKIACEKPFYADVDYLSIVIAFLAIVLTTYTAYFTRKHNRLSVKPHLDCLRSHFPDSCFLKIENSGLGTALITDMTFTYNNKKYKRIKDCYDDFLKDNKQLNLFIDNEKTGLLSIEDNEGFALAAGKELFLIKIIPLKSEKLDWNEIKRNFTDKLDLNIEYKSLYNIKYSYHEQKGSL